MFICYLNELYIDFVIIRVCVRPIVCHMEIDHDLATCTIHLTIGVVHWVARQSLRWW